MGDLQSDAVNVFLANTVLVLHVSFVGFVVLMVPLVFLGGGLAWTWVRGPLLRWLHLLGILVVVLQSWLGIVCPLTTLEMWLRRRGGDTSYSESFIEHWLQALLYWQAPWWVFVSVYTFFALLVVLTWLKVPPRKFGTRRATPT